MSSHKGKALKKVKDKKWKPGDITHESIARFKAAHPMSEAMKKDQIRRKLIG